MSQGPKRRVLLIDDAFSARITLAALLEDAGFHVTQAESLAVARKKLVDPAFDLAIVDLNLKDGLGTELIPDFRRDQPQAVIVLLSGENPQAVDGVTLFLTKASAPDVILQQLNTALAAVKPSEAPRL